MKTLITLIKREYWENKGMFFRAPVIFGGFLIFVGLCYLILLMAHSTHEFPHFDGVLSLKDGNIPPTLIADTFYSMSVPFIVLLWITVFIYCFNCLYSDRKDRSILFWQSLPIAEWQTMISKALAAVILAPLCTLACIVVTEFIFLILLTIAAAMLHIGLISNLWQPIILLTAWINILKALALQAFWLFPIIGWFMLSSAFARKSPFFTAIIPIIALAIVEGIFFHSAHLTESITACFDHAAQTWHNLFEPIHGHISIFGIAPINRGDFINGLIGLGIGLGFMGIAGVLRHRCFRTEL